MAEEKSKSRKKTATTKKKRTASGQKVATAKPASKKNAVREAAKKVQREVRAQTGTKTASQRARSRRRSEPRRPRTLITGASSGIGRELALVFADRGHDLVLVARRGHVLEEVGAEIARSHDREVTILPADLLEAESVDRLAAELDEQGLEVEILVNNAGVLEVGRFVEQAPETLERLLQLNVLSLTRLTRRFLPGMVKRGYGRILNVASIASFQPVPGLAVYAASKAFVLSFTEALSEELRGTGVRASALCPGITDTEMVERAREDGGFGDLPPALLMSPRAVARAGYRAMERGRVIEIPGITNELVASWVKFQPRWLVRGVSGLVGKTLFRTR